MFNFLKKIFKKNIPDELDIALKENLITKEEFLKLRLERAEREYENFVKLKKK